MLDEVLTSAALTPWWSIPLDRPFSTTILATDASTSFGFGASAAEISENEVKSLCRLCSQTGDAVTLQPTENTCAPKGEGTRVGKRVKLSIGKRVSERHSA